MVLDEGHKVKNEEARISKSVRKLHATSILLLTVKTPDIVAVAFSFFSTRPYLSLPAHMPTHTHMHTQTHMLSQ